MIRMRGNGKGREGEQPHEASLKPSRGERLRGFFSRPKSPAPAAVAVTHAEHRNDVAFAANIALGDDDIPRSKVKVSAEPIVQEIPVIGESLKSPSNNEVASNEAASKEVASNEPTDIDISDVPGSAWDKAWLSLSNKEREELKGESTIRQLFVQLQQDDNQHQEKSPLRKGLSAVSPYMQGLGIVIDVISPFASVEPMAGTVLGLVKGASSIAVALCGSAGELTQDIELFLERIPVIDRCDDVVGSDGQLSHVHEALVNVYKDLLQFHLKAATLFKGSNFLFNVALSPFKQALPEIMASFNKHADRLSSLLEPEIFVAVQEIKYEQTSSLIRDTLGFKEANTSDKTSDGINQLGRRDDAACKWINENKIFINWAANSADANLLVMFGEMGSGKSTTAAYLAADMSKKRYVCVYHCRDDPETTKLGNIYRSLLMQLLAKQRGLKVRFQEWQKKMQDETANPTGSDKHLKDFLVECLAASKRWNFIVLDGLDECSTVTQKHLIGLFGDVMKREGRLKVFISSRYDEDIMAILPTGFQQIDMISSKEKDRIIATYMIDNETTLSGAIRDTSIDRLSELAEGSAIWMRIAVEYIKLVRIRNERGLQDAMKDLPASKNLAEIYSKLFDKICSDIPQNANRVRLALETLAVARRPLTSGELASVVFIELEEDDPTTVAELDDLAESVSLLGLIRPFVAIAYAEITSDPQFRLVHQSLKELILQAPPSKWNSVGKGTRVKKDAQRLSELNDVLLTRCVKYLLFDEFEGKNLLVCFPDGLFDNPFRFYGDPFGNFGEDEEEVEVEVEVKDEEEGALILEPPLSSREFDPADAGFGNLFAYAASYWTDHFADASSELRPDVNDLIALCSKSSQRMVNWYEQWRRPSCSYKEEREFPGSAGAQDPLIIAAMFGSSTSVADILNCDIQAPAFWDRTIEIALEYLIKRDEVDNIRALKTTSSLRSSEALRKILAYGTPELRDGAAKKWEDLVDVLITETPGDLLQDGNGILRSAVSHGMLWLVRRLFAAADLDSEFKNAILATDYSTPHKLEHGRAQHQTVGEAAFNNDVDMLRFLCQQSGIESHIRYVDQNGDNIFHHAAHKASNPEIWQILIKEWPGGDIDVRNRSNWTPLQLLCSHTGPNFDKPVASARILLATGRVQATIPSLSMIIRQETLEMSRILVMEGSADVISAIKVDESGRPDLRDSVKVQITVKDQEKMLKVLCRLVPIAVSTDFLF